MQHEEECKTKKFLKSQRTTANNKISEGAMVTAEDGQEFHTGTALHNIYSWKVYINVVHG